MSILLMLISKRKRNPYARILLLSLLRALFHPVHRVTLSSYRGPSGPIVRTPCQTDDPVSVSLPSNIPASHMLIHDLSSLPLFVPPSSRLSPRDPNIPGFVSVWFPCRVISCRVRFSCLCSHSYYRVYARPRRLSLFRAPSPLPSPDEIRSLPSVSHHHPSTLPISRPSFPL
jgi:hypothetical protein